MVKNAGETLRAGAFKPLNMPEKVLVEEGGTGMPQAVRAKCRQRIESVEDRWRLDDEWWRIEPVSRIYYTVRLASGQKLVIYKDLISGTWYRQSY